MASAEAAKRLGPLIRNQTTTMGLYNLPKQCGCPKHPYDPNLPEDGTAHDLREPCPFEKDNFPRGRMPTCCSLRGEVASSELCALRLELLALAMHVDMTAEKAAIFSRELSSAADEIEREYAGKADKLHGAGQRIAWNAKTRTGEYQTYSTFEEALNAIREAARWYEKIAGLGFGVHAWF